MWHLKWVKGRLRKTNITCIIRVKQQGLIAGKYRLDGETATVSLGHFAPSTLCELPSYVTGFPSQASELRKTTVEGLQEQWSRAGYTAALN